jgi:hypothetical protein
MVKIEFERRSEFGVFRDSIVLPDDHTLTEQQILELQEQRFQDLLTMMGGTEE